jgi:hypothetical protein
VELRQYYWYRNLLRYSASHYSPIAFRAICLAVVTGSMVRGAAAALAERSLQPLAAFASVMRYAGRKLIFGWRDEGVSPGIIP